MNQNIRRRLLLVLMAGAGLVMACVVYAEIRARPTIQDVALPQEAPESRIPALPGPRPTMPEKANFAVIVERPLFSPSRRRPAENTVAAPIPALDFSLFGVVISTGEPFALVKPDAGGDPVHVAEGENISGWTIARIDADRIVVRHDTTERELLLDFSAPAPPPPETAMPNDAPAGGQAAAPAGQKDKKAKAPDGDQASQQAPQPEAEEPDPASQSQAN